MKEIFLTSSALILIISVLRFFLRGKISPRLQYALWLLAAARLLIPGSLFTAPVSIIGVELPAAVQAVFPETPPQNETAVSGNTAAPAQLVQKPAASPVRNWPGIIWKTGVAVTGGAMLLSNLRFAVFLRRKRRKITLPPSEETGGLPVYLVEDLPSPCLFGLLQPCIYVNSPALDPVRLPYILAHERTHFRHGDHVWVLLRAVCLTLHWYNPLVWLAAALCRRDCELACDDGVIWMLGENRRLEYGGVLLKMVSAGNPSLLRASTSMSSGKRSLMERITMIAQRPRMLKAATAAAVVVMCAAVTLTFGGAEKINPENLLGNADSPPPDGAQQLSSGQPLSTQYTHFSGLFSLTLPENWLEDMVYVESEDGVAFYEADSNCWLMTVVPEPVE
nr:M56 family metallopeptidase [Oscillospiraceae bacterium]